MNREMYDRLNETEKCHWWFKTKREIVEQIALDYIADNRLSNVSLADFGCGTGLLLHELEKLGNVTGYDISDSALAYCKEKSNGILCKVDLNDVGFESMNEYDIVFALDILEHIENDINAMKILYNSLKKKGCAIITVPAYQWMWSQNDINNMHCRRYSRKQLVNLAKKVGFSVNYVSYYNFWLFVPIVIVRFITKILNIDKHSSIEYNSGSGLINELLYRIFASEKKRIEMRKKFPFGVSLIMIVNKDRGFSEQTDSDNENIYWDRIAEEYADEIMAIQPTFYRNCGKLINSHLRRGYVVADIGNGGVINYNFSELERLDCIDLTTSNKAIEKFKNNENIRFVQGNVFHLDEVEDATYDRVIMQCVIHHLAGENYNKTESNTIRAINECIRVLKPGGQLLILESTVKPWFEKLERVFYPQMQLFFKLIKFDTVYQYSAWSLLKLIRENVGGGY